MPLTGLDWSHFNWREMEFYGMVSFLKTALVHADALTTVSPTYAREIQTAEYGHGLEGLLARREDHLAGIVNGVDYGEWDPATDPHLPAHYGPDDLSGKRTCRDALLASEHLRDSHRLGSPAPLRVYGPTRAATRLALASFVLAPATLGHRDVSRPLATGARIKRDAK